jgi:PAS domain S-box-containing protein
MGAINAIFPGTNSTVAADVSMPAANRRRGPIKKRIVGSFASMNHQDRISQKVLVVDDDPISRKVTANVFRTAGCIVKTAQDGIEALTMVKDFVPDLMVIDLIMPYLKGDRLCRIIREMELLREVKLVILSGVADEVAASLSEFGADACIAKGDPNFTKVLLDLLHCEGGTVSAVVAEVPSRRNQLSKSTTTKELLVAQHRLEFILQNMVEPLFEFADNGRIVFANQSAVSLSGVSEYQLLGSIFFDLFSRQHAGQIRSALEGQKTVPVEIREDAPVVLNHRMVAGRLVPFAADDHQTRIAMLRDITDRKRAEKALERSRADFHDIVEKNADGILVLDERSHVVQYANLAAGAFLERPLHQLVGRPFSLPVPANLPLEIDISRPGIGEPGIAEMRMVRTDWENRPAILITLSDITPRKQLEQGLKAAKQVAEQASQAKSEFLANMSHELRSPLNASLLLAQALLNSKSGDLNADQVESVQLIHKSGSILLQLIDDILDFSKIEVGRMDVYVSEVKLTDLVDHTQSLYRHVAESKGLALHFVIDDALPDTIRTDHQKLEQILRNLITNAIKFTPHGSVKVELQRPVRDPKLPSWLDPHEAIAITVTDTGIGVPAGSHESIFDAFKQADGSTSRRYGGTGLGLSISKKLANLLGGDICLAGTHAQGSKFSLVIPQDLDIANGNLNQPDPGKNREDDQSAAGGDSRENASEGAVEEHQMLTGKKALVVDDEARNLFSIAKILEDRGLVVHKAKDGHKALALLEQEPGMNFVLMDIMMPGMDGYETIRRIRKAGPFGKLPIIALAPNATDGDRAQCLSAGADDYLSKPVVVGQLMDALTRLARRTQS